MRTTSSELYTVDAVDDLPDSLQDIFTNAFECVARVDYQGCYLSVNAAYAEVCGYTQEEMVGMAWQKTVHSDDLEFAEQKYREVLDTGRAEAEIRGIRKNNSVFYKQLLMVKGLDSDASSIHHYFFINDITERVLHELIVLKSVKAGLELQEQQFHDLIKDIPGVVFQCDANDYWSFSYLSPTIEKLLGIPSYQLLTQGTINYASLICEDDRERVRRIIDFAISENKSYTIEYRITRTDGVVRWFRERATSKTGELGEKISIGGIICDITESKQSEKQLQIAQILIDNAGDLVLWMDEEGRFVYANNIACEVLGYERDELLNLNAFDVDNNITSETPRTFLNTVSRYHSASVNFESTVRTKNDREIKLDIISNVVEISGEIYTCVLAKNITTGKGDKLSLHIHQTIHQLLVANTPQQTILETLCSLFEEIIPHSRMALFILDENDMQLHLAASPSLHQNLAESLIDIIPINPATGNYNHEDVVIKDLLKNTLWKGNEIVEDAEVSLACRIAPFYSNGNNMLGSLVILLEHNSLLSDYELEFLHKVGNLASLVVETSDMREQLLRFEKIIESTDDLIVYVDSEYCFRVVSNRYAESHNSTREKIVGKSYPDIVGEKMFYENIRPYLDRGFGGEYVEFKEWFEQTLNDRRYYQVKINPVRDGQKIIGVIIIMRDITQMFNVSEALRETEGRYQSVLENSTDIMVISHLVDGEIVTANEAFSRATGHEPKDYIGAKAVDFYVNPQDRNVLVNRLTREGHCADFETQITTKDGRKVPVLLSCSLIEYDDEQCILTVARDLSDRKLVEEELKDKNRSISLLQKITVAANEASSTKTALQIVLDEICEFCHWPVGHAYILNTTTENLESCCVWHTEPVDKFAAFKQLTEKTIFKKGIGLPGRVLDKKSPVWIEDVANDDNFPRAKSDRNIDVISAFGFPVLVEDKVVAVLEFFNHCLIAKDEKLLEVLAPIGVQVGRIIERKQAEKALRQSQVNFSKAVNACPDSVVIIRLSDGKILDINDAVLEATGYSREELIENGNGMMFWVDEQACKDHAKTIKRQGKVVNYSMLTKRKDGSTIPCLMSSTLIDVDGDKCAFSIVKDISDLTIAYEEIRQRERQAQVITDSTSVCISYVDTDLRYVFNNMEFQQEFGIDKASILGKTIIEVVGAHRYEHLKPYISTALSGKDVKFEMAINNSRGEELVYELTYHPDRKGGVVKGIYIASSNITERKNTELALTKTNRALRVLSECSKILVKEREEEALLQAVCNVVIEEGGYQAAWVGYVETEKNEGIQSVAFASGDHGAVRNFDGLEKSPINTYLTRGVISSGGPLAVRNSPDMIKDIQWRAEVVHDRYVSALGLPLKSRGIFLGVMVISSTEVETFDEEEIKLFASMAENLTYGLQSIRESRKRKKAENLLALENHAFQLIATLPALPRLLDDLVKNIEMQLRNKHCLLLLLNDGNKHFYDGASPSMDENYVKAVIGPVIEENSGPCSRAAYLKERITVEDTHTDPFWKDYCQLERDYHYHSCCVTPITAADGRVLGTFTIYSRETGTPDRYELQIVDRMTFIIGGAVDSYQVEQALKENEERFVLAMKGSQDGLWDVNLETNEAYWSPRWKSMLGYAENELEPSLSCFLELLHPDDKEVHEKIVNEGKDNFEVEYKMKHKQGHYVDILSRATGLRNNSGKKVTRLVGTHTDLTERNRAALRIKESERQFRTLYDDSPSMFLTLDENGIILSINKFGADHLGFSVASLIGKSVFDITHDDDGVIFMQKLKACTSQPEKVQRILRYIYFVSLPFEHLLLLRLSFLTWCPLIRGKINNFVDKQVWC